MFFIFLGLMFSEADTRSKFVDPKLYAQGWKEEYIVRERSFTDGRKLPGGKRSAPLFLDYLLKMYGLNLAIIEAKKYGLPVTEGLEQVKNYGKKLGVRWVYTSNGEEIYERDMQEGDGKLISSFPSPEELYERYTDEHAVLRQQLLSVPYFLDSDKKPRYYQDLAITRALSALAEGKERILLTLATGTGKTFIAFQIVYKLLQAKWSKSWFNRHPRVLFLADRNILIDQALNTFNPIEKDCKSIKGSEIKKALGKVPTSANVFFSIYQALISGTDEETEITEENLVGNGAVESGYYRQYDPDFFDLIIIDECHRGGAKDDGNWAEILKYFSSAVHLGMTATPKNQDNINTYAYFAEPVYQYSLKEGIEDGFLTPYKVKRIRTNLDELVIDDKVQILGGDQEKDLYELKDFDRKIIVPERIDLIAKTILEQIKSHEKTIVFCVDQEHAALMRDAINRHKTVRDGDYCVRVTSNEGDIWRKYLELFQDNGKTIPTILTTSQMLTTGVDAKNVRNIVLLRTIGSIVEFKQIIGRGTRVFDGKDYFTIIDFTGATNLFYDEKWDWPQVSDVAEEHQEKEEKNQTFDSFPPETPEQESSPLPKQKLKVKLLDHRELKIINIETRYIGEDGKPLTAEQYLLSLVGKLPALYQSEEQLRTLRSDPKTREELLAQLRRIGLDQEQFGLLQQMFEAPESDLFDVLTYLSYGEVMKTRAERVRRVLDQELLKKTESLTAKSFLEYLLEYYHQYGSTELVQSKMGELIKLYGRGSINIVDFTKAFGGQELLMQAWKELQKELFRI